MKQKVFIYTGFIIVFIIMAYQAWEFSLVRPGEPGMFSLEVANADQGKNILDTWFNTVWHHSNLLAWAKLNLYSDFLFIAFYVSLGLELSCQRIQLELWPPLMMLLRLNLVLVLMAGLLDVTENLILLHNIAQYQKGTSYISSRWFSWPKFILMAWATMVWLLSFLEGLGRRIFG